MAALNPGPGHWTLFRAAALQRHGSLRNAGTRGIGVGEPRRRIVGRGGEVALFLANGPGAYRGGRGALPSFPSRENLILVCEIWPVFAPVLLLVLLPLFHQFTFTVVL